MRRLTTLLTVLALLSGWQQALLHPLEHTDDHGRLVHVDSGHAEGDQHEETGRLSCDTLAALAFCIGTAAGTLPDSPAGSVQLVIERAPSAPNLAPVVYLSQGPPRFS